MEDKLLEGAKDLKVKLFTNRNLMQKFKQWENIKKKKKTPLMKYIYIYVKPASVLFTAGLYVAAAVSNFNTIVLKPS